MADGGYLEHPAEGEKPSRMWEMTWQRIDKFLPNLYKDIYPETKAAEANAPDAAAGSRKPEVDDGSSDANRDTITGNNGKEGS